MEGVSHQTVAHGVQAGQPRLTHTFAADRESPFMKPDTGKLYVRFVRRTEASSSLGASSDPTPLNPGNAGGGKGPQFKTNARRSEGPGDWATYQLRRVFRNCRRRCTRKRRRKPAIPSTPCTTRSAAKTSWPMPMLNAAPTRARRVWTVRTSRTSKRMGCNDGLARCGWLLAFENPTAVETGQSICITEITPVARQAARRGKLGKLVHRWHGMLDA